MSIDAIRNRAPRQTLASTRPEFLSETFHMRVVAIGCTFAVVLLACPALAGDFEDGMTAYERKDYAKALPLLRKAADQGVASAQFNLGVMYLVGQGVTRDDKQAVSWFRKGAAQGAVSRM